MFKDYYKILEIGINASPEEIKAAFKKQSFRWHPDRNSGIDTTRQMQNINEAYIILKNPVARARYNAEYQNFQRYRSFYEQQFKQKNHIQIEYPGYVFRDDILKKWIENAMELSKKTMNWAVNIIERTALALFVSMIALSVFIFFKALVDYNTQPKKDEILERARGEKTQEFHWKDW